MQAQGIRRGRGQVTAWTRRVVAGLILVAPVAAQGNVIVLTDAQLDLRVIGDELGSSLLFLEEYETDALIIRGLSGTTVNGQTEIRPFFGGTRIRFDMRGGDDSSGTWAGRRRS
jgi:hypothetical protein